MAMETSILKSTKKNMGIAADYTAFDLDILTWVNSAFSTLRDLGLGPANFFVDDDSLRWEDFGESIEDTNMIKTYVLLRVKVMFDPPATQFTNQAMQEQINEQLFRLSNSRESRDWEDPRPVDPEEVEL